MNMAAVLDSLDADQHEARQSPGPRGRLIALAAVLSGLVMLGAAWPPLGLGALGSLLQSFLPWLGLSVPLLMVLAAVRRSPVAAAAVLVPAVAWSCAFGGLFLGRDSGLKGDVTVVSHNVHDANPDPVGTAHGLAASGADLVALEELTPKTSIVYEKALAYAYPYHAVRGTVGLWSVYPLQDVQAVAIMPWTRALHATADTPEGPLAVYVGHLASIRLRLDVGFTTERRNDSADKLAAAVRAEPLPRVVVVGDFNGTTDDTALRALTGQLRSAQVSAGHGFGFTWPATFPVVRIDQILVKGVTTVSSWTLPRTGSDHLPVAASLRL